MRRKGETKMRNRKILIIFMSMNLVLFLTSKVLAQAPIEGWDKAKFGMTLRS